MSAGKRIARTPATASAALKGRREARLLAGKQTETTATRGRGNGSLIALIMTRFRVHRRLKSDKISVDLIQKFRYSENSRSLAPALPCARDRFPGGSEGSGVRHRGGFPGSGIDTPTSPKTAPQPAVWDFRNIRLCALQQQVRLSS